MPILQCCLLLLRKLSAFTKLRIAYEQARATAGERTPNPASFDVINPEFATDGEIVKLEPRHQTSSRNRIDISSDEYFEIGRSYSLRDRAASLVDLLTCAALRTDGKSHMGSLRTQKEA